MLFIIPSPNVSKLIGFTKEKEAIIEVESGQQMVHSLQVIKGIMEIGPDIKNMTLNEYFKYEAKKERQSWRNVRSKSSPTRYEGEDFNSSHRDKSITLDFPHYYEDAFVDKYYALPPLLPCFRTSQPHNERGYESPNTRNEVDIDSMTIAKFNLYIARQMKNLLNNPSYGFTPQFFAQPPNIPNTLMDKKDSEFDEILDDLFRIGAKNLRRMGQEKVWNGCDNNTSRDTNHESGNLLNFPIFPLLMNFLEFDITVEDVELIRQFLTPNVPDEIDEEAKFNPTKDIKELERLLAKDPQSYFTEIQVHSVNLLPVAVASAGGGDEGEACGGAWWWGSGRSGDGEAFGTCSENSLEKFFGGGGGRNSAGGYRKE
ncbi:hypothetical protein Tco_0749907 [Tanacetum coccineum]|uniref:Uncharacterized protein n=1 Tax=Tanacetum coccineum TaxID=301880 RepID=A0ABQ4Z150_9ASTR